MENSPKVRTVFPASALENGVLAYQLFRLDCPKSWLRSRPKGEVAFFFSRRKNRQLEAE